jgi:hypothetical protein
LTQTVRSRSFTTLLFKGSQVYLTNASLFDDGVNSRILVLQAALPGQPLN